MLISVNDLLAQDVNSTIYWLTQVEANQQAVHPTFNWLGLAQSAASEAHHHRKLNHKEVALAWALVAVKAYEHLVQSDSQGRHSYEQSAMMLRAKMIEIYRPVADDPVLDVATIIKWFSDQLPYSLEHVQYLSTDWREQSIDVIRTLRHIKNRLAVVRLLVDAGHLNDNHEVTKWLALRNKLP